MKETLNKFSNNFKHSLKKGADLALELKQPQIEPLHILYGLISQRGSVAAELFTAMEIKVEEVKNQIAKISQTETANSDDIYPAFSATAKTLIQKAVQIAYTNGHQYIGTEHLLASIIQIENQNIKSLFKLLKINETDIVEQTTLLLKSASKLPEVTAAFRVSDRKKNKKQNQTSILDVLGRNLTNKKFQENIDPVIGREAEIERIIQILSRRFKNNPLILGEPGVGKTAIVEGLAKKISLGQVPEILLDKKIYTLDLTSAVAGTIYRGEFEQRLKQVIEEAKRRPEIILFIDEIHNLVGAGSASGSMDAANILKPALARGEIRCIGATTFADYHKSIENDPALERRFQTIKIDEPSIEATKKILHGLKENFENFHGVAISDEAIHTAVELSHRYLPEKFLPDKAIDLIDEAMAGIKVAKKLSTTEKELKNLQKQLAVVKSAKETAIEQEDFASAIIQKEQLQKIVARLEQLKNKIDNKKEKTTGQITATDIAKVISRVTGMPLHDLLLSEKKKILNINKHLGEKIIGQDQAVNSIAEFIRRAKAGLTPENKPLASFLLVGPSGVGKTHTAKTLAKALFGDEQALIRVDASEYSERFNISKLIGAPAGYVGYKESGHLTEKVKRRPYSLVLFDEIEKADSHVFDLLLQVLDDGYLTDASGTKINFRNTIIILTSNLGSELFGGKGDIGFGEIANFDSTDFKEKIYSQAKNHFKIEFLNRLDKIIYFQNLDDASMEKIVKLELMEISQRLLKKNITLNFNNSAIKLINQNSRDREQGARGIKKTIQELIETLLSEKILRDEISPGDTILVTAKNGIIKAEK